MSAIRPLIQSCAAAAAVAASTATKTIVPALGGIYSCGTVGTSALSTSSIVAAANRSMKPVAGHTSPSKGKDRPPIEYIMKRLSKVSDPAKRAAHLDSILREKFKAKKSPEKKNQYQIALMEKDYSLLERLVRGDILVKSRFPDPMERSRQLEKVLDDALVGDDLKAVKIILDNGCYSFDKIPAALSKASPPVVKEVIQRIKDHLRVVNEFSSYKDMEDMLRSLIDGGHKTLLEKVLPLVGDIVGLECGRNLLYHAAFRGNMEIFAVIKSCYSLYEKDPIVTPEYLRLLKGYGEHQKRMEKVMAMVVRKAVSEPI